MPERSHLVMGADVNAASYNSCAMAPHKASELAFRFAAAYISYVAHKPRVERTLKDIRGSLAESHVIAQYPMSGIAIDITTPPAAHV